MRKELLPQMARPSRRPLTFLLALALGAALLPVGGATAAPAGRINSVGIVAPAWIARSGEVAIGVRVTARGDAGTVTARLRVLDASGHVRWERTRTRTGLESATYDFSFASSASDLGLTPGVYRAEAAVRSGSAKAIERTRQLIVFDPAAPRLPVSVVVRVAATPSSVDASRSADASRTANDAMELARLSLVRPDLHLTAAVPPFLLDEWSSPTTDAVTSAAALDALRSAVAGGLPLLRGMYGEPDLSALASAPAEIERQADAGHSARDVALATDGTASVDATGFAVLSGLLPAAAGPVLHQRGVTFLLVSASSLQVEGTASVAPVRYRISLPGAGSDTTTSPSLTALVIDRALSAQLTDPSRIDTLTATLFARSASKSARFAVVLEVLVGEDGATTDSLEASLDSLLRVPWVRLVDAPAAAVGPSAGTAVLRERPVDRTPAPGTLAAAILRARTRVDALVAATEASGDTTEALKALMLAESRAWAGTDGTWAPVDGALALASVADDAAWSVLSKIKIAAPAVTLPGSSGKVPVSVVNDSDRVVTIVLDAISQQMKVRDQHITARLEPGENILSVPVALGTATSGRLDLTVRAGDLDLARATTTVKASYLDRIALLATVVLVLVGLLFYIRRKMARGAHYTEDRDDKTDIVG